MPCGLRYRSTATASNRLDQTWTLLQVAVECQPPRWTIGQENLIALALSTSLRPRTRMRSGQIKSRPNELAFAPFISPKGIKRTGTQHRSKDHVFRLSQRSSRTSVCSLFFDRASSKSQFNIIASLCPSTTKASTQNHQTHPPLPRAFLVRHSSLNYREFKTENWQVHPTTSIHPILNPFKLLA